MKILYIATKSNWGGAQRYIYDLATAMRASGFDTSVAAGGEGPLLTALANAGIRTIPIAGLTRDIGVFRELGALGRITGIIRRERPDVLHLSSSKAGGIGAAAAWMSALGRGRRPFIVFTVHGWAFSENRPRWQRGLIALASWLTAALADRVVIISTADYRSARRFISEEKLAFIPHGIRPPAFLPRAEARRFIAERTGLGNLEGTRLIGTIAELTRNKGIRYLLQALSLAPGTDDRTKFRAVIIGEGEEREVLKCITGEQGLSDVVTFIGSVPEAARYLPAFDLFVLPSVKEGLPYSIMEAMAAGLPIVGTAVGGIPDLVEDGVSGRLVPPANPQALARAIGELLGDTGRARAFGLAAHERFRSSFPFDRMIERTRALYRARR